MRYEFVLCGDIPRLGWCAHVKRGGGVARVYHGPWVEARDTWFVEGAWTGEFEKGGLDTALHNAGTGGVIRGERAVFCTPTDVRGRLQSIRVDDDWYISNSLVFLLEMAGEELDPSYPFYTEDLRRAFMLGISVKEKSIHTWRGTRVWLHDSCQLAIDSELKTHRIEKPAFAPPRDYHHYVDTIRSVSREVLANAASPARQHVRYGAITSSSGGYDANAVASILASIGVREGMTFYDRDPDDDSGARVLRALGMHAHEYGRDEFRRAPNLIEAEFLAYPRGIDIVLAACEELLVGKIMVTGRFGDIAFGLDTAAQKPNFEGGDHFVPAGATLIEFRLRIGMLSFSPLYSMGHHLPAIHAISISDELKPWRIGGVYDRPIARRIIEEAGVPRGVFGIAKAASANYWITKPEMLRPDSRASFETLLRTHTHASARRLMQRGLVKTRSGFERVARFTAKRSPVAGKLAKSLIPVPSRYQGFGPMDFAMHWGHAVVGKRYAQAVSLRRRR